MAFDPKSISLMTFYDPVCEPDPAQTSPVFWGYSLKKREVASSSTDHPGDLLGGLNPSNPGTKPEEEKQEPGPRNVDEKECAMALSGTPKPAAFSKEVDVSSLKSWTLHGGGHFVVLSKGEEIPIEESFKITLFEGPAQTPSFSSGNISALPPGVINVVGRGTNIYGMFELCGTFNRTSFELVLQKKYVSCCHRRSKKRLSQVRADTLSSRDIKSSISNAVENQPIRLSNRTPKKKRFSPLPSPVKSATIESTKEAKDAVGSNSREKKKGQYPALSKQSQQPFF